MINRWLAKFLNFESSGGILLFCAAVLAIVLENSPLRHLYEVFLHVPFAVKIGTHELSKPILLWINDGLMALFFLLVGLELKREFKDGELSSVRQLLLPLGAAIGGMLCPAICYVVLTGNSKVLHHGWAIPTATDIAFALGVLSFLSSRVPNGLRVFLTSLAIFDDLGAILIIAFFYSSGLSWLSLILAAIVLVTLYVMNRVGVTALAPFCVAGLVLWVLVLKSGVHATLAGVALALMIPHCPERGERSPLIRLEQLLHPWVAYAVLPIFGFANAGVSLKGLSIETLLDPLVLGIAGGLFIGKQVGIFASVWLMVKLKLVELPKRVTWAGVYGISLIAGIGFTMSLFIGTLAFRDAEHLALVRVGVIIGSMLSGVIGFLVLRWSLAERAVKN